MTHEETSHPGLDPIIRKKRAAEILSLSPTTIWRLERAGVLVPIQILPGVAGYKESTLRKFIETRAVAVPNTARLAAALASPRHGRAGRASQAVA